MTSSSVTLTTPGVGGTSVKQVLAFTNGSGTGADPLVSLLPDESTILRIRGSMVFPKNIPVAAGSGPCDAEFAVGFGVTALRDLNSDSYPAPISEAGWDG